MTEKYLWAAAAAIAGLTVGYAISDRSVETEAIGTGLEQVRSEIATLGQMSQTVAALSGKLDALSGSVSAHDGAIAVLSEDMRARLGALDTQTSAVNDRLAALDARTTTLADGLATLGAGSAAMGRDIDALGSESDALGGALSDATDTLAGLGEAVAGVAGEQSALREALTGLRRDLMAALGKPPAPATPQEKAAPAVAAAPTPQPQPQPQPRPAAEPAKPTLSEQLAGTIGADGLILSVGQTGMLGEARLFLSRLSDDVAHLRVFGPDRSRRAVSVSKYESAAAVSDRCSVALAGIASGRAYFSTECRAAPATADPSGDEAARLAALVGADGLALSVGQTGTVGASRVFLSRLAEDGAHLRIAGTGRAVLASVYGDAADVGGGCTVSLAGIAGRRAYLTQSCDASGGAGATGAGAAPADMALTVGQTGQAGDLRIFLSRLGDTSATLVTASANSGRQRLTVAANRPARLGPDCAVALTRIGAASAGLKVACGDDAAGLDGIVTEIDAPAR